MIPGRTAILAVIAFGALLAIPAAAPGAVTVGPDVSTTPLGGTAGCTTTGNQDTFINSGPIGASPISGVVVRFRVRAGTAGANGLSPELRIVESVAGGYTGAGSGGPTAFASGIATHDARLPITAGQFIGVDIPCNANAAMRQTLQVGMSTGATGRGFGPELTNGGSPRSPNISFGSDGAVLINADVEPDCDGDGFGDETQDSNLSSCAPGTTTATCKGKPATIVGTEGSDVRKGTSGKDVIVGLGGNDKLSGLAGNDVICGGAGKDTLKGGKGKDTLLGQQGKDTLKGGAGTDTLKGGAGKDKQIQ